MEVVGVVIAVIVVLVWIGGKLLDGADWALRRSDNRKGHRQMTPLQFSIPAISGPEFSHRMRLSLGLRDDQVVQSAGILRWSTGMGIQTHHADGSVHDLGAFTANLTYHATPHGVTGTYVVLDFDELVVPVEKMEQQRQQVLHVLGSFAGASVA